MLLLQMSLYYAILWNPCALAYLLCGLLSMSYAHSCNNHQTSVEDKGSRRRRRLAYTPVELPVGVELKLARFYFSAAVFFMVRTKCLLCKYLFALVIDESVY